MKDKDRVFELRQNIIDDWRFKRMYWRGITYKYRISSEWFYKLRKRFLEQGYFPNLVVIGTRYMGANLL